MATTQHKMEEFLSAIVQGKTFVWTVKFDNSTILLTSVDENNVQASVDLEEYPCHVRKDFIHKLRLADISSLAIVFISVVDEEFERLLEVDSARPPHGHPTLIEDIAEIIKTLQSTPTAEESNMVGDGESQNGQAVCNVMEAASSSTHQIQLSNRTLKDISIEGILPSQKLKALWSLIVAPGSTVKSVNIRPSYKYSQSGFMAYRTLPQYTVLEEVFLAQKGGSCPALERLKFDIELVWKGTSVERLREFLQHTPSIKEIVFDSHVDYGQTGIEGSLAEKLAEALCLNNQVHTLRIDSPYTKLRDAVMRVLMCDSQGQHPITALNCLHLQYSKDCKEILLCEFIKTTKCLNALRIIFSQNAVPFKVIEALKFNHGLEHFTWDSGSYAEDVVFSTIMDALRVNYQLKDFVHPWRNNYYAEALTMLFEERATNKPWEVMKDMVLVPSTSARLFFCGYPHAGDFLWLAYLLYYMHAICEIVTK